MFKEKKMTENNRVSGLLASEPGYRWTLLKMLEYCAEPRSFLEVQEFVLGLLKGKVGIYTPDVLLQWLEETGGLEQSQIDGEGRWLTTPAGVEAIEAFGQGQPLRTLLTSQPEYSKVYLEILEFCSQPRRRQEIEEEIAGDSTIQSSRLHPAYFIDQLEKHGGLEWRGNRWQTTPDGKGVNT
jgi:hypothetical protein